MRDAASEHGSRVIQVTVTDDAAGRIADTLQAVDLHAEAACIRVLLRDRTELRGVVEDEIAMSEQTAKTLRDLRRQLGTHRRAARR